MRGTNICAISPLPLHNPNHNNGNRAPHVGAVSGFKDVVHVAQCVYRQPQGFKFES